MDDQATSGENPMLIEPLALNRQPTLGDNPMLIEPLALNRQYFFKKPYLSKAFDCVLKTRGDEGITLNSLSPTSWRASFDLAILSQWPEGRSCDWLDKDGSIMFHFNPVPRLNKVVMNSHWKTDQTGVFIHTESEFIYLHEQAGLFTVVITMTDEGFAVLIEGVSKIFPEDAFIFPSIITIQSIDGLPKYLPQVCEYWYCPCCWPCMAMFLFHVACVDRPTKITLDDFNRQLLISNGCYICPCLHMDYTVPYDHLTDFGVKRFNNYATNENGTVTLTSSWDYLMYGKHGSHLYEVASERAYKQDWKFSSLGTNDIERIYYSSVAQASQAIHFLLFARVNSDGVPIIPSKYFTTATGYTGHTEKSCVLKLEETTKPYEAPSTDTD